MIPIRYGAVRALIGPAVDEIERAGDVEIRGLRPEDVEVVRWGIRREARARGLRIRSYGGGSVVIAVDKTRERRFVGPNESGRALRWYGPTRIAWERTPSINEVFSTLYPSAP